MSINDGFADCDDRTSGVDDFSSIIHSSPYVVSVTDKEGLEPNSYNFNQRMTWYVTAKQRRGGLVRRHIKAIREEHSELFQGARFVVDEEDGAPQTMLDNFIDPFYNTVTTWAQHYFPSKGISLEEGYFKLRGVSYPNTEYIRELIDELEKQGRHVGIDMVRVQRGPDYIKIYERENNSRVTKSWNELNPESLILA